MHRNEIFYALICINNHVLSCLISMLSEAPELIIHDREDEVSRANVPDVEGAGSDARLAEEEASILAKCFNVMRFVVGG